MSVELLNSNESTSIEDSNFSNTDAELAVIGCILWDNKNYEKVSDFLDESHFVDETNKIIFSTIKNLLDKNILVSPITLKNYLPEDKNNLNKVNYLNQIKDSAPSTQNTFNYAKIIYDLYVKRNLLSIAHNLIQDTNSNQETTADNLIETAENNLYLISQSGQSERSFLKFTDALKNEGILYTSFKYGEKEQIRNGRFFADYTEERFDQLLSVIPKLELIQYWKTSDLRPGRSEENWLNILLKKIKQI